MCYLWILFLDVLTIPNTITIGCSGGDGFWWIKHDGNILRPLPSHLETSTFESFRAVKGWMEKSAELFHNCEISRRWIIIRNSSSPPSPPERMRIWKWLKWGLQRLTRNWHFRRTNSETIELSRSNIFLLHAREIQIVRYITLYVLLPPTFFSGQRKSNAFLDVPSINISHLQVSDNEDDNYRLRTFSSSKGGEYKLLDNPAWLILLFHRVGNTA